MSRPNVLWISTHDAILLTLNPAAAYAGLPAKRDAGRRPPVTGRRPGP